MPYALLAALLALGVFIGMVILQEAGRRVGHRRLARDPEGARAGVGAIDGAVFGLLALLVAFTFSGAASRFDARRQLYVILDIEYPRLGLIRVDAFGQVLVELRESMK